MEQNLKTISDCRLIYTDILNGYSCVSSGNFFVKHYTELDFCKIEQTKHEFSQKAIQEGILSEKEKINLYINNGHWSKEEEEEYENDIADLEGLNQSIKKLVIPQQKKHMAQMIEDKKKLIKTKYQSRRELVGTTRETYISRRISELFVLKAFYKDSKLTQPYFANHAEDDIDTNELEIYMSFYDEACDVFTDSNLRKIAVCPFFLNTFLFSNGNPHVFYGKPIIELTVYQLALFSKGSYYKNILEEGSIVQVPEEYYEDLDKVVQFYDKQYSIILGKRNAKR